ncbi:unnamed protein product [Clonostachys rosea]|uniref:Uncharacterized protein n=1 Tax=Bionectria ochroleuca TaxID=29856 RepID=A0ABY6U834_BIOOC|nr:unnamed protein product [Clonostachys rosea]
MNKGPSRTRQDTGGWSRAGGHVVMRRSKWETRAGLIVPYELSLAPDGPHAPSIDPPSTIQASDQPSMSPASIQGPSMTLGKQVPTSDDPSMSKRRH